MAQRGRKSSASLSIVPLTQPAPSIRPQPPARLGKVARDIWRSTTSSRPADYFDAASLPMLEAYCRAHAEYLRVQSALESMNPKRDAKEYARLARTADSLTGRAAMLATKMRLSQQSRYDGRTAARKAGDHRTAAERMRASYRDEQ